MFPLSLQKTAVAKHFIALSTNEVWMLVILLQRNFMYVLILENFW